MSGARTAAQLEAFVAAVYRDAAVLAQNDPNRPAGWVLYVETVVGTLAWTVAASNVDVFDHVRVAEAGDPLAEWDPALLSATPDRLRALVDQMTGMPAAVEAE
jgi:hypothetical protein